MSDIIVCHSDLNRKKHQVAVVTRGRVLFLYGRKSYNMKYLEKKYHYIEFYYKLSDQEYVKQALIQSFLENR